MWQAQTAIFLPLLFTSVFVIMYFMGSTAPSNYKKAIEDVLVSDFRTIQEEFFKPREGLNKLNNSETQRFYDNICIDQEFGIYHVVHKPVEIAETMIYGVNDESYRYTLIPVLVRPTQMKYKKIIYVKDGTLLVFGGFQPFHLAHTLINSLIPIENTLQKIPKQYSNVHIANVVTLERELEKAAKYGFPIDVMKFEKLFTAKHYEAGSKYPLHPLPIYDSLTFKEIEDITYCYPLGVFGLNKVCAQCPEVPKFEVYESLRQKVLKYYKIEDKIIPKRVLIIQRKETRKLVNIMSIIEAVKEYSKDYKIVFLEKLTFREQIRLFVESPVIIAPHGNGNAHIHWMKKGGLFLEGLGIRRYGENFYKSICEQKGIEYHVLPCYSRECHESKYPQYDDVYMDPEAVRKYLEDFAKKLFVS